MSSEKQPMAAHKAPWPESNGVFATYHMHCHCGAIKYNMKISPPLYAEHTEGKEQYVVTECNCSYCERNGYLSVHPLAKNVEFTQGLEHRREYYTGAKKNPHWFCAKCACVLGTDLTWLMREVFDQENRCTINVRMLKDFDPEKIKIRKSTFMKGMEPKHEV